MTSTEDRIAQLIASAERHEASAIEAKTDGRTKSAAWHRKAARDERKAAAAMDEAWAL